ncbi:AAA-domain-containing protein [Trematosphaeria pertusa]|uniref:AAA-domain-containing protein n=1 Tax=Trematosphaeria pertusa TaxID=390896 RepID=A0A6A6J2J0_9PLEO|nr:AAA-domain-containing protein [Trematosphaeria pertusa]KAF2256939.1 AAA-domain-containing protein [Trematosphaeria pertusa]
MYGAIRPTLRASTRRPPARFIRGRRYPSSHRTRSFHSTPYLAVTPTPPAGPDNTPVSNNGVDKKNREKAAAEQTDTGIAAEDPEILAQKLQRSREMTRRYSSALRRSQRRNRAQDLPPVVVPNWFLRKRVFTREEMREHPLNRLGHNNFTLSLQRLNSEEAGKFSVPLNNLSSGVKILSRLVFATWNSTLSADQRRQFARQLASSIGAGDNERVRQLTEVKELIKDSGNAGLLEINQTLVRQEKDLERVSREYEALMRQRNMDKAQIPPLALAEIRATIAASLSALPAAATDTFPSTKTNLILHSPSNEHDRLIGRTVMSIASELGADVVVLEAQDLAEIAGDYLGDGADPSPHSIRSLGYETYRLSAELGNDMEELWKEDPFSEDQEEAATPQAPTEPFRRAFKGMPISIIAIDPISKSITQSIHALRVPASDASAASTNEQQGRLQTQGEAQLEDLKLSNLLEALIDSSEVKRSRGGPTVEHVTRLSTVPKDNAPTPITPKLFDRFFDYSMTPRGDKVDLAPALPIKAIPRFGLAVDVGTSPRSERILPKSKIIYVQDIKELNATQYGNRIIQKLEDIVRKQRRAGESIMIVGSSCSLDLTPDLSANGVHGLQSEGEAGLFRTIVVPTESADESKNEGPFPDSKAYHQSRSLERLSSLVEKKKFRKINLRHIQSMLRCLDPLASRAISDDEKGPEELRAAASVLPESYFWKVLTYDEVHRIALTALGLQRMDHNCKELNWAHVALAMGLLKASDEAKVAYIKRKAEQTARGDSRHPDSFDRWTKGVEERMRNAAVGTEDPGAATYAQRERQLQNVSMGATKHEKRLLPGIANPDQIKTTFDQVHVSPETVDSIRTLTSMSLLRPDAFNYGVLATEKISGALLYGPPGTGKTLLAKAVAKESGCTVLEVSGSQIMDKYVGEGEKNVAAIFSLARKLTPCIVFLDEADAIFGSRDTARERTSHRDILNQFLKEWDGLNDLSVFVMVATNRPFDLDDAVIRRLPRRLLVDLPTQADRKEIMKIHLRGEQLDESVDLEDLAKRTPFYSGSDLKNLAVSAALACVREENEQAAVAAAQAAAGEATQSAFSTPPQLVRGQRYTFPEKRVLYARHFDKALIEISASISEDMSSLNAIKKFDEKYGDKMGKKKRSVYGFGIDAGTNENAARVRT